MHIIQELLSSNSKEIKRVREDGKEYTFYPKGKWLQKEREYVIVTQRLWIENMEIAHYYYKDNLC